MKTLVLFLSLIAFFSTCDVSSSTKMSLSPATLPDAEAGKPYQVKISAVNNDTPVGGVSIRSGQLPEGLQIEKLKGEGKEAAEISGTPQKTGTYEFSIHAWCFGTNKTGDSVEQKYTLTVK